jgi:hypothetical protein
LRMLLLDYMGTGKEVDNFTDALALLEKGGQGANKVLGEAATITNTLKYGMEEGREAIGRYYNDWLVWLVKVGAEIAKIGADIFAMSPAFKLIQAVMNAGGNRDPLGREATPIFDWRSLVSQTGPPAPGGVTPPAPWESDKAGRKAAPEALKMIDNYDKTIAALTEDEEKRLKELDEAWLASTATWREGIDKTADSLGYLLIDLPFKGKDAWRSFIDSMLSMLRELAAEFISTTLKAQGLAWLKQATGGGGGRGYEESPGFVGPHSSSWGGPRPIGPGMGGGMQPVYVNVSGSLTKYAEFKIVSTGLKQGRQAGF